MEEELWRNCGDLRWRGEVLNGSLRFLLVSTGFYWSPPTVELYRGLDYGELGVRGTVVMDGFWTGADCTDYTEAERREDGAPVEAGLRPMR